MLFSGNLSALQAALEAHQRNKADKEKQTRKNPAPLKKYISVDNEMTESHSDLDYTEQENSSDSRFVASYFLVTKHHLPMM